MSLAEFLHLLAVLAWPTVALIASVAVVRCCRMLVSAHEFRTRKAAEESTHWRGLVSFVHGYWASTYNENRQQDNQLKPLSRSDIVRTSESALLALLAANGAFLGRPDDKAVRQIVREVREMYSEIERPTQATEAAKSQLHGGVDEGVDDLTLDEVYSGYNSTSYQYADDDLEDI